MPNTYTQITIHAVFAVKYRENMITSDWRDQIHKYYDDKYLFEFFDHSEVKTG